MSGGGQPVLERRLGTADAAVIGIGSMVGAGVFSAIGPAAAAAGSWLVLGLALAAVVAYCNAVASAQLAAQYPLSGGTYVYGREQLGPWWGFGAGWCFVTGKTASCAAMALTFGAYVAPDSALAQRLLGIGAVVLLTAVTLRGVERTAHLTRALVAVSVAVLVLIVRLVLRLGARTLTRRPLARGTLAEWAVSLDLVLWATLVRHLVLLLDRALDARFLTN